MFKTMNSSYLREIPLRILNRKIGDEHVTLLQACYDNPIFHEEDGKRVPQQNGGTGEKAPGNATDYHGVEVCNNSHDGRARAHSGGHAASEYMHSLPPTSPTSNDVTFRGHRKRKRRCILCTICVFVALVVGLGLLIYLLEGDQSSDTTISSSAISLLKVEVNLTLYEGPFSQYQFEYRLPNTDASKLLRRAFIYKISDVFSSSDISYIYNKTEIVRISNTNGSVSLTFNIQPPPRVSCPANCEARITNILLQGLKDSLFIVASESVSVKIYDVPDTPFTIKPPDCKPITFKGCVNKTGYSTWSTPNILGHKSEQEVVAYVNKHRHLLNNTCHQFATQFFCSTLFPDCTEEREQPPLFPCKQYCKDVMTSCQKEYEKHNLTVPFKCDDLKFPDEESPILCTQKPVIPGKCVPNTREECVAIGFNMTTFPNALSSVSVDRYAMDMFRMIISLEKATHCSKHSELFACSIISPPCSGKEPPNHFVPPCRSFCQDYKDRCKIFWDLFGRHWQVNCSAFPDSPDKSICIGYHEAREPDDRVCYQGQVQCSEESKMCVDKDWFCDGEQDCPQNSDEMNCARCGAGEDRCSPTTSVCIPKDQGCDGIGHCYEDTDETYCLRLDPKIESDKLEVRNPERNNGWEEVCEDGWTNEFSNMTCRQLGYNTSLATYYTVQNNVSLKSVISVLKNGSDPNRLQGYLLKGRTSCPSGKVVQLLCWKAVCGARPAHVVSPMRVLGGNEVLPGTWPWMVSLHGGSGESFFCGASIIADEWVLTAAHCIGEANKETGYWSLKTGNTRRNVYSEYRQVRKPKRLFRHKEFNFDTVENDLALIQLDHPFKFNDYVRAICLPDQVTRPGTRCHVVGWGRSNFSALDYERSLRQVPVDVLSWSHCLNALEMSENAPPYKLKKSMFCAGGTQGHDSCQGDSGGPLLCRKPDTPSEWYQSGVVSWGIQCGLRNVPGVYTNLTLYLDWIHAVIANNTKNTDGRVPIKLTG